MTSGKTISLSEEKKRANKIGPKRIPATVRTALRCVLGIALLGALLAASAQTGAAQTYSVLYSFRGYDGATPGPVIRDASTGNLYGATMEGGTGCQSPGCGTIFKVTAPGVESVVHSFTGESADGAWPLDVLRDANGNLFAVTTWGGVNGGGDGVISEIDSSGVEKVLHRFEGGAGDGYQPSSGLIQDANSGDFYGVTGTGGAYNEGTLYKITATGVLTILYSFGAPGTVGSGPEGKLLRDGAGNFYGMLEAGVGGGSSCGALFELTPAGVETTLYAFTGKRGDGCVPYSRESGLVMDAQGNLFGTTWRGGIANEGVVFELTAGDAEKVLHKFRGYKKGDGATPYAGLILDESTGNLYGTTGFGGAYGSGTVFKLSPPTKKFGSWHETILYSFTGGADGGVPAAGVVRDAQTGILYGTADSGGAHNAGVVFELTP